MPKIHEGEKEESAIPRTLFRKEKKFKKTGVHDESVKEEKYSSWKIVVFRSLVLHLCKLSLWPLHSTSHHYHYPKETLNFSWHEKVVLAPISIFVPKSQNWYPGETVFLNFMLRIYCSRSSTAWLTWVHVPLSLENGRAKKTLKLTIWPNIQWPQIFSWQLVYRGVFKQHSVSS